MSPLLVTSGGQWRDAGGNTHAGQIMAPAWLTLGTQANTGCRIAEASLTPYAGSVTSTHPGTGLPLQSGDVVEGFDIAGRIVPTVGGITFRDLIVRGGMPDGAPSSPTVANTWALVDQRNNGITTLNRYEYVTLAPSYLSHDVYGFRGANYIALRCKIGSVVDGFNAHGSAELEKAAYHWGCWMDVAHHEDVDPRQVDGTHDDNVQAQGRLSVLEILFCTFMGGQGATILLQKGQGTYGVARVNDNLLYGHPTAGAVFNMSESLIGGTTEGYPKGGLQVLRNKVDPAANHTSPSPFVIKPNSRFPENFGCTGTDGSTPSSWTPGPDANTYIGSSTHVALKAG